MNAEEPSPDPDTQPVTHCPCCLSNTCAGREALAAARFRIEGLKAVYDYMMKKADRFERAFNRNRIVIEMLAKYPEEDEHGR